ncbi:1-phosphofructokinase [Alicyclobacillus macrosporangiidus]|uniref:Tagatose-6-phosphate kinase n=1 Tax=Alicyclobacillus macrosporangiidus TaxID=392015 RepID=A0A1I7GJT5_9BACL|nr:1-phosphofructokinase [Alicyclobacillus macrosporangiidus]SFU48591.1 1-phosphofructokinase [Alicyclobacillus macrosporangiidus]
MTHPDVPTGGVTPAARVNAGPAQAPAERGHETPGETSGPPRVVTVTVNPAVDLFLEVHRLTPGTLHRVPTPRLDAGGKGINVAKALRAFGVPVAATGFLGGSRGAWIREVLAGIGVIDEFVSIPSETRLNVKVVDSAGQLTELNTPAPPLPEAARQALADRIHQISFPGTWVAFCGNLPAAFPAGWYREQVARARRRGVRTVLDASGEALREGVAAGPDLVKPNRDELEQLAGHPVRSREDALAAARRLHEAGVGTVIASLGGDGLVAVSAAGAVQIRVPRVPVVSAVGAGDTVVAAYLAAQLRGLRFVEAVRFAAAAGTAAVMQSGSGRPKMADIEALMDKLEIQEGIA